MATRDWKSKSVTDLLINGLTWVGARDTYVSKNDRPGDDGTLKSGFLLGVIDLASASA